MQTHANMAFPNEICQQSVLIIKIPFHIPYFNSFINIAMLKMKFSYLFTKVYTYYIFQ